MRPLEPEPFSAEERAATLQRRALKASVSWRIFFSEMPLSVQSLPLLSEPSPIAIKSDGKTREP